MSNIKHPSLDQLCEYIKIACQELSIQISLNTRSVLPDRHLHIISTSNSLDVILSLYTNIKYNNSIPSPVKEAILYLSYKGFFNGTCELIIFCSDPFLILRSDRLISNTTRDKMITERKDCWVVDHPDEKLKPLAGFNRVITYREGSTVYFTNEINFWTEHHNRDSPYYLCNSNYVYNDRTRSSNRVINTIYP